MKKIVFSAHILPHLIAIATFLIVTVIMFKPVLFDHKKLQQHDIQEWEGSSKELRDFRNETGEEGLWANSMFSGMPAYLINVQWGYQPVSYLKKIASLALPHPVANIFLAFTCYYVMLLAFGIRPYLAIAGAIAFGLSSYMLIGMSAGHNARIGAIAFTPLIMAGIHLAFTERKILGFGLTTAAFSLHLRENHLQITYYFAFIVLVYGIVQLVRYYRAQQILEWVKNVGILVPAVLIAIGSFFGPLWAITEYTNYSIRGKSELVKPAADPGNANSGTSKEWAFEFSNGILEPMTLLIPNFYGGASSNSVFENESGETYRALSNAQDSQLANQLVQYTSAYWGPQRLAAPYYAGAIIIFLFAIGIAFADKHWVWWLVPIAVFGIALSWGKNFASFNYFMFDYFPGYNKFRSVTFALVIALFAFPLLGFIGLERVMREGLSKQNKRKILISFGITGGLCLLSILLSGALDFMREEEKQLPAWFINALAADRKSLLNGDAFRSFAFVIAAFILIYFNVFKKAPIAFYAFLIFIVMIDLVVINKRYIREENFTRRTRENNAFTPSEADEAILKDKTHYRVFALNPQNLGETWNEARTSYFHNSIGGYHGAKLKRYQDLLDSCLYRETIEFLTDAQNRNIQLKNYGVLNMLNTKYLMFGQQANAIFDNPEANGNAWFVQNIKTVNSPSEELREVCDIDTRTTAVIDISKFTVKTKPKSDSTGSIQLLEYKPNYLKYESNAVSDGIAVFSEIFYEKGWKAFLDQKEVPVLRANYVLRALEVPEGKHSIEFRFEPAAYVTGNKITTASSWLVLMIIIASIGFSVKKKNDE